MGYNTIAKKVTRNKKHRSVRKKVFGTSEKPRLVVFKSNRNIYAQLVNDEAHKTLTGVSTLTKSLHEEITNAGTRKDAAAIVGRAISEKAKDLKVEQIVFDRGGYLYHGVVKALADGAREGGLKF